MKKFTIEKTIIEGANTYVEIMDLRTGEIFEGSATCCNADKFDFEVGQKIAYQRACIKANLEYGLYLDEMHDKLEKQIAELKKECEAYGKSYDDEMSEAIHRQDKIWNIIGD